MNRIFGCRLATLVIFACAACTPTKGAEILHLSNQYANVQLDDKGFIISLTSRQSGKEYSPAGHPSPLMSLHEDGQPNSQLLAPVSASFHAAAEGNRTEVSQWGNRLSSSWPRKDDLLPLSTDLAHPARRRGQHRLGAAPHDHFQERSATSSAWSAMTTGPSACSGWMTTPSPARSMDGDCYQMGYYIHSPDPVKYPAAAAIQGRPMVQHRRQWSQRHGVLLAPGGILPAGVRERREAGAGVRLDCRLSRPGPAQVVHPSFSRCCQVSQRFRPRHQVSDPIAGRGLHRLGRRAVRLPG